MRTHLPFKNKDSQKWYMLLLVLLFSFQVQAQKEAEKIKEYLTTNAATYKLSTNDLKEMSVSSAYLSPSTGWYHMYYIQNYQSVEVYNGILNVAFANDKVINVSNNFIENIAAKVSNTLSAIQLTPVNAISKAAVSLNLPDNQVNNKEVDVIKLANGQISKAVYTNTDLSNENIDVKLYWFVGGGIDKGKAEEKISNPGIHLVWNVQIYTKDNKSHWSVKVDATSGEIVSTIDQVIHCDFGTPQHTKGPHICSEQNTQTKEAFNFLQPLVNNTYNVFDYPLESPLHGARTNVTNPYTKFVPAATGPGSTNGWHHTDTNVSYTITRGNNVWAKDDIDANNTGGSSPDGTATLTFDFPYTQDINTAAANRNAAITNLFYWNNIVHDVLWKYGFDEVRGNFQSNNMGRGGAGNDYVNADAQDGSGTDNANFATPPDGQSPRMQMYIWSNGGNPTYQPDSDFDNGIISHEYGHGWSNRLTGGPANVTCLQNAEQGGEGWSDYLALMLTTNWSTLSPNLASANISRGVGNYSIGQPTTAGGIRPYPYSYDMANVNPLVTYGNINKFAVPHGVGAVWATMLWDMTWEIIMQDAQIVNNIYTVPAVITDMRGNIAALKLVNEGLALQACSPSFIDARNAILTADQNLFGGRYKCAIWKAFARRGLGMNASTGASSNDLTVTEDFTPFTDRPLSSAKFIEICSKTIFNYTATTATAGATTFSWTRPAVVGISNAANSGNTASINETLINTTKLPIVVTYYFLLTPSGCQAPEAVKVTVLPSPTPTVANYSVCQNGSVPVGQGLVGEGATTTIARGTLTTSSPTYRRGAGNNVTTYGASSVGTNVYYQTHTFTPTVSGSMTLELVDGTLNGDTPYDAYMTLYQTSFNPASPATNFVRGDDDGGRKTYAPKIIQNLTAGTTYILVVTTYFNGVTGNYTIEASSPVFPNKVDWYLASSGGSSLFRGNIFNPVGVAGSGIANTANPTTKTYYLADSAAIGCRTPTVFTVSSPSVGGTVAGSTTVCFNTNSGALTLSGHTGSVIRWESSTDNFASVITPIVNTTTTYNYLNITQTMQFRAVVQNGACAPVNSSVATITKGTATTPTGTGASSCGPGSVTLTASGCPGGTINWYNLASGGSSIATGTSYATPVLSTTTNYYITCTLNGCTSNRVTVVATITPIPNAPTGTGGSRCGAGSVTLSASGCIGGSIVWYSVSSGGSVIFTGGTYATPNLDATTTYYAACTIGGCTSGRTPVIATININGVYTGNQTAGTYRVSDNITSTANVATGVNYYAGKTVLLNPGFQAGGSETFLASILGCEAGFN